MADLLQDRLQRAAQDLDKVVTIMLDSKVDKLERMAPILTPWAMDRADANGQRAGLPPMDLPPLRPMVDLLQEMRDLAELLDGLESNHIAAKTIFAAIHRRLCKWADRLEQEPAATAQDTATPEPWEPT